MRKQRRRLIVIFLWGMVAVNGLVVWYGRDFIAYGYGDFTAFYTAGKLLRTGQGSDLYDRDSQWRIQEEFASRVTIRKGPLPYIRPPFEALIFAPLSVMRYPVACVAWMGINTLILFTIPGILGSSLPDSLLVPPTLAGPLLLSFGPVAINLLQGQDAILLLLCFALAFRASRRKASFRAGIFLGLGLVKFHLVLPVMAVLAVKKKWRVVVGFICTACVLVLVSAEIAGWSVVVHYPAYLWQLNRTQAAGVISAMSMPNIRGALAVIFGKGLPPAGANLFLLIMLASGIFIAASTWRGNRDNSTRILSAGLSFTLISTLLCSYYAYSYDMTLLLLPLLLLGSAFLDDPELRGRPRILFLSSAAILCCAPLYWMISFGTGKFCWMMFPMIGLGVSLVLALHRWRLDAPEDLALCWRTRSFHGPQHP